MNLLFPAGGRRVEIIELFRRMLPRDRILVADVSNTAPALYAGHKAFLIPKFSSPACLPALLRLCRREKVDAIVPLIDPELEYYAEHADAFARAGVALSLCRPEAVRLGRDKRLTHLFFREVGAPICETWRRARDIRRFPAVAKPASGSAGQGVTVLRDRAEAARFAKADGWVFQPRLKGEEITVDVIGDGRGAVWASCQRLRLKTRAGEAERAVTVSDPSVDRWIRRIVEALKPYGAINIQLFRDGRRLYFQEMNLRLGGGSPLACLAGVDLPGVLRALLSGARPPAAPKARIGLHMLRFDRALYLTQKELIR